jgi:hypothetical protein
VNFLIGLCQTVIDSRAFSPVEDESGVLEVGEVSRSVWLGSFKYVMDVAHAEFAMEEKIQYP